MNDTKHLEKKILELTKDLRKMSYDCPYSFSLVFKRAKIHKERLSYIREWHKNNPEKYVNDLLVGINGLLSKECDDFSDEYNECD